MGLSNEERIYKFYKRCTWLRKALVKLLDHLKDSKLMLGNEPKVEIVQGWINDLDDIVGQEIAKSDTSSAYWLFGSNKENFESYMEDYHNLDENEDIRKEPSFASFNYYRDNTSIVDFVKLFKEIPGEHTTITTLAHWWDCWQYTGWMLYAVNRYDDNLFVTKNAFIRLLGKMVNGRFDLIENKIEEGLETENLLLCKYHIFNSMMRELESQHNKHREPPKKNKKEEIKVPDYDKDYFNIQKEICEKLMKMTVKQVIEFRNKEEDRKFKWDMKYDRKQYAKEKKGVNWMTGRRL